jgi:hypothetical protein
MAQLIGTYQDYQRQHARLEESLARVGVDAFLSGHDGWYFHRGLRTAPGKRHV